MPKKGRREAVVIGDASLVISPNPAPIGTTRLDISGAGFSANTYLTGTILGRAPSFECPSDANGFIKGVWENENAPLGVGVVNTAETHSVTIADAQGNVVLIQNFEVV